MRWLPSWPMFRTLATGFGFGLALLSLLSTCPAQANDGTWVEFPPPTREAHSAIYDPVRDRLIVFGGNNGLARNDVWVLPLVGDPEWTRLEPSGSAPSPRAEHTAVYDPVRDRMIVFGGSAANDVWALSLSGSIEWQQIEPLGDPPEGRSEHVAVYDPVRDRILIHGGISDVPLGDTWALSLSGTPAWTQVMPSGTEPSAMYGHVGIYDPVRDRLVIWGGSDTWALTRGSSEWSQIQHPGGVPSARADAAAIYDPVRDRLVLLGGNTVFAYLSWALPLNGTQPWVSIRSFDRRDHAAVYHPPSDAIIAYGGHQPVGPISYNSTMRLVLFHANPVWTHVAPATPSVRTESSGIFDPVNEQLVVFGGDRLTGFDANPTNATWLYSTGIGTWMNPFIWPWPDARVLHTAVMDPGRGRMVVFGGDEVYGIDPLLNDVWTLDLVSSDGWLEISPLGAPPAARFGHSAIYDPSRDRMLVFGGSTISGLTNDLWQLSFTGGPQWVALSPSGVPPSPRYGHSAVYDPVADRMLVYGGDGLNDLWALSLGDLTWTQLAPSGVPPTASPRHIASYDPIRERLIVISDADQRKLPLRESLEWLEFETTGFRPSLFRTPSMAHDSAHDRLLVYPGDGGGGLTALLLVPLPVDVTEKEMLPTLVTVTPNPSRGVVVATVALSDDAPATLELLDITGRRLDVVDVGTFGRGRHRVLLGRGMRIAPGVYYIRLHREGQVSAAKVALIR